MIATPFSYVAPATLEAAVTLLAEDPRPEIIGGGTWVVPEMVRRLRAPERVVDLWRIGLDRIRVSEGAVVIGATTTYRDLIASEVISERLPLLRALALGITGGPQVRNRGTVGGSACYATPTSDVPACLVALGATLRLRSVQGVREVAAAEFFVDAFRTAVGAGELLTEIVVPPVAAFGYYKFKFCESSWPIITAAFVRDDRGERLALGGVEATPVCVELTNVGTEDIVSLVAGAIGFPWSDALATGAYRKSIAGVVARRAMARAEARRSPG